MTGIDSVLEKLQGIFGWGYLLAGVFPVAGLSALSLLVAYEALTPTASYIAGLGQLDGTLLAVATSLAFTALLVLGFVVWALNPLLRRGLEGGMFVFTFLKRFYTERQRERLEELEEEIQMVRRQVFLYRRAMKKSPTWKDKLAVARGEGETHSTVDGYQLPPDLTQCRDRLIRARRRRLVIEFDEIDGFAQELANELRANPASRITLLDELQGEFLALQDYGAGIAENRYERLITDREYRFPAESDLAPTEFGNAAVLHRDYALTRYGLDIEYFWTRLHPIVAKDEHLSASVESARVQMEYAVAMVWTSAVFTVAWSFILALTSTSVPLYASTAIGGAVATVMFYRTAVRKLRTFSDVIRSAIDLHRFDLLKALHIPLPTGAAEEPACWTAVAEGAVAVYHHE